MVSEPTSVVFIVLDIDMDESVEQSITGRKNSAYHCCVPLCNGDSRYHEDLRFHRIPGRTKDEKLKKEWLVKIRRDEGPDFKVFYRDISIFKAFGKDLFGQLVSNGL